MKNSLRLTGLVLAVGCPGIMVLGKAPAALICSEVVIGVITATGLLTIFLADFFRKSHHPRRASGEEKRPEPAPASARWVHRTVSP